MSVEVDRDPTVAAIAHAAIAVGSGTSEEAISAVEALADLDVSILLPALTHLVLASAGFAGPRADSEESTPAGKLPGLERLSAWEGHDDMARFVTALVTEDRDALSAVTGGTLEGFVVGGLAVLYALGTPPPLQG